jgi:hypothetical protein
MKQIISRTGKRDLPAGDRRTRMVVAKFRVQLKNPAAENVARSLQSHIRPAGALVPHDTAGPVGLDHVNANVRNLAKCLLPGDSLPLPLTAFPGSLERVVQTTWAVEAPTIATPFLTPSGIEVGNP